jgi:hypothetical protein
MSRGVRLAEPSRGAQCAYRLRPVDQRIQQRSASRLGDSLERGHPPYLITCLYNLQVIHIGALAAESELVLVIAFHKHSPEIVLGRPIIGLEEKAVLPMLDEIIRDRLVARRCVDQLGGEHPPSGCRPG